MAELTDVKVLEEIEKKLAEQKKEKEEEKNIEQKTTAPLQNETADKTVEKKIDTKEVEKKQQLKETAEKMTEEHEELTQVPKDTVLIETPRQEMANIQQQMLPIEGRDFVPIQQTEQRMGVWDKFKNRLKVGVRWSWGATFGAILSGISVATTKNITMLKEFFRVKGAQKKRDHDAVPGREGEKFEEYGPVDQIKDDDEIYSDVRRGPLVWEKLTAGDPDEPPEVIIMAEQSKRGSGAALETSSMGHTMVGLVYSRYNKTTKRKERYQIRMGFYPAGGAVNISGTLAMTGGALMPGQLKDDSDHHYDVARRYTVSNGDINRILRAAETYADGGYGYFKRNCTTFAIDMAATAHLPIAQEAEDGEMVFHGVKGIGVELGEGMAEGSYYTAANTIAKNLKSDDLSYQNFGQKRFTLEDLRRYYGTALSADVIRKGYSPGAVGETLRASTQGDASAFFLEDTPLTASVIADQLPDLGVQIWEEIQKIIPNPIEEDILMKTSYVSDDAGLHVLLSKPLGVPTKDLREVHKIYRARMKNMNEYYRGRLHNDARLNELVMKYLSMCEAALTLIDARYRIEVVRDGQSDVGRYRAAYMMREYEISYAESGVITQTTLSPGQYEGYLMAGRTPEQIVKEVKEFKRISAIPQGQRSGKDQKALERYLRVYKLANDFASANRYLMWKDEYTQKDMDYAFFVLPQKERQVKAGASLSGMLTNGHFPSDAYKASVYEKIFDGFNQHPDWLSKDDEVRFAALDGYLLEKAQAKTDMFKQIVKCYVRNKPAAKPDDIFKDILMDMSNSYIKGIYCTRGAAYQHTDQFGIKFIFAQNGFGPWVKGIVNECMGVK